ncbi:MAG: hypothetical protein IJW63_08680 [Lachnospiraceae bacterium]|nr:hypothetical protein [Lachnospiraceae bacterium]
MIALQITSMKQFMNQLLSTDIFDIFLLQEATITGAYTHIIDGTQHLEFYGDDDPASYPTGTYPFITWKSVRGQIFDLIKGKHTPLNFKIVLHLLPEHVPSILAKGTTQVKEEQIKALVLTIRFDGGKTLLTTATSFHSFLMDKEPDKLWDESLKTYLGKKEVGFEILS